MRVTNWYRRIFTRIADCTYECSHSYNPVDGERANKVILSLRSEGDNYLRMILTSAEARTLSAHLAREADAADIHGAALRHGQDEMSAST